MAFHLLLRKPKRRPFSAAACWKYTIQVVFGWLPLQRPSGTLDPKFLFNGRLLVPGSLKARFLDALESRDTHRTSKFCDALEGYYAPTSFLSTELHASLPFPVSP